MFLCLSSLIAYTLLKYYSYVTGEDVYSCGLCLDYKTTRLQPVAGEPKDAF
jgi:hypothetical protein